MTTTIDSSTHILVVDDESGIMTALTLTLELEGYRVSQASNGLQALQRLQGEPPDLMITDYMMPHMDGIELMRSVRDTPSLAELPIILMSAGNPPQPAADELADRILPKPFTIDRLLEVISQLEPSR